MRQWIAVGLSPTPWRSCLAYVIFERGRITLSCLGSPLADVFPLIIDERGNIA
jgi:hypothetical protein